MYGSSILFLPQFYLNQAKKICLLRTSDICSMFNEIISISQNIFIYYVLKMCLIHWLENSLRKVQSFKVYQRIKGF